ncbi:PKD domain-containing protein [Candidatus Aminicenantes bacterium AC-708-M15]|jgi:PKD repeat protein|nr:PKD domain-containing protein [SCandidatus Aminicenantes bacterium Aminicenantia_JdfR_composite]MCP2596522.1 PKD domain-containing protein [Candidatus Aminicenantes bacterium AC-335-G13]MCP2603919.1 PKD domain-containing protein [Candidatus Aminicenantes bacterium AC-708-M15]MCP2605729.1 PKD domain-containing protein [Candidatus Aminicenantes bacterium AC-335-O07]MCP2618116.1 PKD domain-containing protein [Candidatus Aminicenantes bacterium AC-335-A11]
MNELKFLKSKIVLIFLFLLLCFPAWSWKIPSSISPPRIPCQEPHFAVDSYNRLHVVYSGEYSRNLEIFYSVIYKGKLLYTINISSNSGDSISPSIALDSNDNPHIVWVDSSLGNKDVFYIYYSNGEWSFPVNVSNNSGDSENPEISIDSKGNIHIVWEDNTNGNYQIFYKRYSNGKWSSIKNLSQDITESHNPCIAVDRENNIHIAWSGSVSGIYNIYYVKRIKGKWTSVLNISNSSQESINPSLEVNNGNVYVVWQEKSDSNSYILFTSYDGENWATPVNISGDYIKSTHPSIAISNGGNVHVVWVEDRTESGSSEENYEIFYRSFYNEWLSIKNISNNSSNSKNPKIKVNGENRLYVVWENGGEDDSVILYNKQTRPVARAGSDQKGEKGDFIRLEGSKSFDPDGEKINYYWSFKSKPESSKAELSDPYAVDPSFTIDVAGTYVIELLVDDGSDKSDPDTVVIYDENKPPVAIATADKTIALIGENIKLDGSRSYDPNGDSLSYFWSVKSRPKWSRAIISDNQSEKPTFKPDYAGEYVLQLVVNDGEVDSDPFELKIFVKEYAIDFSCNKTTGLAPLTVNFNAQVFTIPSHKIKSYKWDFGDGRTGTGKSVSHTYLKPGIYTVSLTVIKENEEDVSYRITKENLIKVVKVFPPLNVKVERMIDRSFTHIKYVNKITWSENLKNEDVVKYKIYRRGFNQSDNEFVLIATVDGNTFEYLDKEIGKTRGFVYAVTAVDSQGNESSISEYAIEW